MTRFSVSAFSAIAAFALGTASISLVGESHVRIVRLSSVEGQVQMDRATGEGLERAILNTPVLEGARMVTGSDGLAEVEFENQSALRLTEDSEVKFSQLAMNDDGDKINQIEVVKGLVYLDTAAKGNDTYRVTVGKGTSLLVRRDTQMRLSATPDQLQLAVVKGNVEVENQSPPLNVEKKETLTVDVKNGTNTVAKGTEPMRFDTWNKERQDYGRTYAESVGYGGPNHAYGLQDLNYYGDFLYASGYGYVWQPYGFANSLMSWDPYGNGAWTFSPGLGYSWVSAYPWGWLPYHYGSWAFVKGTGWVWVPGNQYRGQWYGNNFQNIPKVVKAPSNWKAATPPAAAAASNTANPTVLVGKGGTKPLAIPGGRVPPNFASLVPGHHLGASSAARGFERTNTATAADRTRVTATQANVHHTASGHVYAPPPVQTAAFGDEVGMGNAGSRATGSARSAAMPSAHGSTASSASHSAGGTPAHK